MNPPAWIVGASTRAAAFSALRAGLSPRCADLFADLDLMSAAIAVRVDIHNYPSRLRSLERIQPAAPFLYTGGLENEPDLIDDLASCRELWGNPGNVLRAARDPSRVAEVARSVGLPVPTLAFDARGLPRDGSWLRKPRRSSGGVELTPLVHQEELNDDGSFFFQERIPGLDASAIFLGDGCSARLVAVTRQLLGRPGAPFAYVGNVGPWPVTNTTRSLLERLGGAVTSEFSLRGLFGIDFILSDGVPWLIEVNPRYTASVEVIEHALGISLLANHARVFNSTAPIRMRDPRMQPRFVGKRVLFARRSLIAPDLSGFV
ncbi:MAG: ATP-grasp domain-containing protein, partial [Planctomycetota bacterium]|nr:ATP-grasp domain-containing protein [Planctomycetota bacterium]